MREILFRGANEYRPPYSWYYGSLNTKCLTEIITDSEWDVLSRHQVNDNTVGQFTGLYDSTKWEDLSEPEQQEWLSELQEWARKRTADEWNGRRIFEGDIIKTKYGRLCKVVWFKSQACFDLVPINTIENLKMQPPDKYDLWLSDNLKVVGNIYDNPELL